MPRLFLGTYLNTSNQTALGQLAKLNSNLETAWHCRIRWAKPAQLHLTWIFFGNIQQHKIDNLCQAISEAVSSNRSQLLRCGENISLVYDRMECWFNRQTPSLIALVPGKIDTNFLTFAQDIRLQLNEHTATDVRDQSQKPFKPHITLLRLSDVNVHKARLPLLANNELPLAAIAGLANVLPLNHYLDTISLIESQAGDGSHQYKTVMNFPLSETVI
jgi:2'-5' RNA ligase